MVYPLIFKAGICITFYLYGKSVTALHGLYTGAEAQVQVVPQGIESVNGSSETMGCTSPLEDSGGVTVCRSQSYLVDGCSPDIDTSTSDWASQLVTVRGTSNIPTLLTFGFETAVSPTGIEIDLFHCPEQGIGAPCITVYANQEYNLAFNPVLFLPVVQPSQSSCDSLLNVSISGNFLLAEANLSFHTFHIEVDLSHDPSIQWVYIGDVRFIGGPPTGPCLPLPPSPSPSMTLPSPSSTSTTETGSSSSSFFSPSSVTDLPSPSSQTSKHTL